MQLIFKSFVLSFSTLWRYLIVMPFVVIPGLIMVGAMIATAIFFGGLFFGLVLAAPMLSAVLLILLVAFLLSSFVSCNIMVCCRAAFSAMGQRNELDFGRLVSKSMTFTLLQMIVWVFIVVVLGGVAAGFSLLSDGFDPTNVGSYEAAATSFAQNSVFIGITVLLSLLSLSISALLAVPMAGSAISATPKMGPTDAFLGIGSAFFPVLAVLVLTQVLCLMSGAYMFMGLFISQLSTAFGQYIAEQPVTWMPPEQMLLVTGMTLVVVWANCWFCAIAALGWNRYKDEREAVFAHKAEEERFSPDDLRRLREMREKNRLVPGH